ncbi:hypothetical protein ACQR1W_31440 [Bradyrhizobium sp. HKCCYLS1011]|uniref:hypothetical protein n=1 Tax=Bradyrhizobium sp. HKCCYLS1011 TaxID=3420733 RepID=UPI003EBBE438
MTQQWMISMEWFTVFAKRDGGRDRIGPNKAIWIIDQHPALYLAEAKQKLSGLSYTGIGQDRADDIVAVHWTMEVPDGMLTEDQVDCLS